MRKVIVMLLVVMLALVPMMALVTAGPALSDSGTATLYPVGDAQVSALYLNTPLGAKTQVTVHAGNSSVVGRGEFQFNLPSLPAGATITSANFSAYYYANEGTAPNGSTYEIHPNTAPWTESGVTWTNKPAFGPTSATATVPASYGWMKWDITTLAQSWLSTPATNYGFVVMDDDEDGGVDRYARFRSKEFTGTAFDPKLEIEYTYTPATSLEIGDVAILEAVGWTTVDLTMNTTQLGGISAFRVQLEYDINVLNVSFVSSPWDLPYSYHNGAGTRLTIGGIALNGQGAVGDNILLARLNVSAIASDEWCEDITYVTGLVWDTDTTPEPNEITPSPMIGSEVCQYTRLEGDVSDNEVVNIADAQIVAQWLNAKTVPASTTVDYKAADVNDDCLVYSNDMWMIAMYDMPNGMTEFPGGLYVIGADGCP